MFCWQSALALTLSVSVRTRASSAVRHAGVCPLSACLAMVHVACLVWPPTPRGRPSVTSYAYGLYRFTDCSLNVRFVENTKTGLSVFTGIIFWYIENGIGQIPLQPNTNPPIFYVDLFIKTHGVYVLLFCHLRIFFKTWQDMISHFYICLSLFMKP